MWRALLALGAALFVLLMPYSADAAAPSPSPSIEPNPCKYLCRQGGDGDEGAFLNTDPENGLVICWCSRPVSYPVLEKRRFVFHSKKLKKSVVPQALHTYDARDFMPAITPDLDLPKSDLFFGE
jgi:hypothetical protein